MTVPVSFALRVVIFALIIPGFGTAVLVGLAGLIFGFESPSLFRFNDTLGLFARIAYGIGGLPAAAVGVAVAERDRRGGAGKGFTALAGLIGGLAATVALFTLDFDGSGFFLGAEFAVLGLAALGALISWKVTRFLPGAAKTPPAAWPDAREPALGLAAMAYLSEG